MGNHRYSEDIDQLWREVEAEIVHICSPNCVLHRLLANPVRCANLKKIRTLLGVAPELSSSPRASGRLVHDLTARLCDRHLVAGVSECVQLPGASVRSESPTSWMCMPARSIELELHLECTGGMPRTKLAYIDGN